jgi:hypothetical protein
MKSSKTKWNYDSPLGTMIMKLKKLATAIEVQKGPQMDIDDIEYRWVDDRIQMMEKRKNGAKGGRLLTKEEMTEANTMWKKFDNTNKETWETSTKFYVNPNLNK